MYEPPPEKCYAQIYGYEILRKMRRDEAEIFLHRAGWDDTWIHWLFDKPPLPDFVKVGPYKIRIVE